MTNSLNQTLAQYLADPTTNSTMTEKDWNEIGIFTVEQLNAYLCEGKELLLNEKCGYNDNPPIDFRTVGVHPGLVRSRGAKVRFN